METFDKPLRIGVSHTVQQHGVNFLATGRVVGICPVPGPAEHTDGMEWCTSRRRKGRPRGDNPQHAPRGVRWKGVARRGGARGTGSAPSPRPAASAAHTRTGRCISEGSSGAQRYASAPRVGSLRPSPWGSHWQQPLAWAQQRQHPGRPCIRGGTKWVSACNLAASEDTALGVAKWGGQGGTVLRAP